MRHLRILHCLRAPVGGLFRHVRDLAREQASRGHAVGLLYDAQANDPLTAARLEALEPDLALGLAKVAMPREAGLGDVSAVRATRDLAAAMQVDILHGHGAKGGAYARLAAHSLHRRGVSIGCFYTPHGGSLHYHPSTLKGRIFMAAERHFALSTDGLIFESAYASGVYQSHVGAFLCPSRIVHNGIAPDELIPVVHAADAADFVFVGELRRLKGVDLLIEALARVTAPHSVRATIVGAGPDADAFKAQAQALGLGDRITFPGAMPARDAFRLGRILLMPSRAESLPYVALEAAGAGLPLIATQVGGVAEIVAGTDTALVPPDDAAALAAAMQQALDAPTMAQARAARLHQAIARGFSVSAMTDGVLAFYNEAAARGRVSDTRPLRQSANSTPQLGA